LISKDEKNVVLCARDLTIRRGNEVLFHSLNFELQPGRLLWLRGSNGSGKTSLLRVVAGLTRPDSGQLTCHGAALSTSKDYKGKLLYLGHSSALKDDLTPMESLKFLSDIRGLPCAKDRIESALRRVGVFHRRHLSARVLSQGQRRRVALARLALEDGPGLWILDEPLDALDDAGIAVVKELFKENVQRGGSVLFTSHIPLDTNALPIEVLTLQGPRGT
jgi:heme exporter protein A